MHHPPTSGAGTPARAPSFELVFRPSAELISVVRCFVSDFYAGIVVDPDTTSRLALATHELLENAAKYSSDGETCLRVEIDRVLGTVAVRARNRADRERIAALKCTFDEIASAVDAAALYSQMLRKSAVSTSRTGGLGLARIWAESEMSLKLSLDDDKVEILASGRIASKGD
jgi:hypothetical protein